jgi:hypothetical protein
MTRHAQTRLQQRAIPPLVVDWLVSYGHTEQVDGACFRFFDKKSRKRLARDVGDRIVDLLSPVLDCYLIEGEDGHVITVGHRYVRVRKS